MEQFFSILITARSIVSITLLFTSINILLWPVFLLLLLYCNISVKLSHVSCLVPLCVVFLFLSCLNSLSGNQGGRTRNFYYSYKMYERRYKVAVFLSVFCQRRVRNVLKVGQVRTDRSRQISESDFLHLNYFFKFKICHINKWSATLYAIKYLFFNVIFLFVGKIPFCA